MVRGIDCGANCGLIDGLKKQNADGITDIMNDPGFLLPEDESPPLGSAGLVLSVQQHEFHHIRGPGAK